MIVPAPLTLRRVTFKRRALTLSTNVLLSSKDFFPTQQVLLTGFGAAVARSGAGQDPGDLPCTTVHWHAHPVGALAFSRDGAYLLSGGVESVVVRPLSPVWDCFATSTTNDQARVTARIQASLKTANRSHHSECADAYDWAECELHVQESLFTNIDMHLPRRSCGSWAATTAPSCRGWAAR